MAKRRDPVDEPDIKRARQPDPGLRACHWCGCLITHEGDVLVTPMGQPHDCATALIWWSVQWGRPRTAEKPWQF